MDFEYEKLLVFFSRRRRGRVKLRIPCISMSPSALGFKLSDINSLVPFNDSNTESKLTFCDTNPLYWSIPCTSVNHTPLETNLLYYTGSGIGVSRCDILTIAPWLGFLQKNSD